MSLRLLVATALAVMSASVSVSGCAGSAATSATDGSASASLASKAPTAGLETPAPTVTRTVTASPQLPELTVQSETPSEVATFDSPDGAPRDYYEWLCTNTAQDLPTIVVGDSSEGVALLQWALTQVGYYSASIGGNYGDLTATATRTYQVDVGLGGSGNVAVNTWTSLQGRICKGGEGPAEDPANDCAGFDLVELQDGRLSSLLASYGIWTNDPGTGEFLGLGGVIDQMWVRWFGSATAKVTRTEFDTNLAGGFLGADVRRLFGEWPYVYDRVIAGLYAKVANGSSKCS